MFKFLKSAFNVRKEKNQLLIIILISFLLSFAVARIYSLSVSHSIYIRGFHIHHFYFGMLALSIGGLVAVLNKERKPLRLASVLIGIGMGLFIDEIGLLLNCTTANRDCIYAFSDMFDIISSITMVIILLIIAIEYYEKKRLSKENSQDIMPGG